MLKQDRLPFPPVRVVKSNAVCRARWSPESILEPRLIAIVASKISIDDEDFKDYCIHVSELIGKEKEYGGRDVKDIESAVNALMSRVITIREYAGWTKYNIFSRCQLDGETGTLTIRLHPDMKSHFLQLKDNFVKYSLLDFMLLPSVYSQRMYELLQSWKDKNEMVIQLGELHQMLDVPASLRSKFKDFKRRVLEKAKRDFIDKTNFRFDWKPIKIGRKIVALHFDLDQKRVIESIPKKEKKSRTDVASRRNNALKKARECFSKYGLSKCIGNEKSLKCKLCREHREFVDPKNRGPLFIERPGALEAAARIPGAPMERPGALEAAARIPGAPMERPGALEAAARIPGAPMERPGALEAAVKASDSIKVLQTSLGASHGITGAPGAVKTDLSAENPRAEERLNVTAKDFGLTRREFRQRVNDPCPCGSGRKVKRCGCGFFKRF